MESFPDYLQAQLDRKAWNRAELARASGIDASLIGRWLRGDVAPAIDGARRLADAIGRPLLEVLVAADLLTAQEAKQRVAAPPDPGDLTNEQLLGELKRRLDAGDAQVLTQTQIEASGGLIKPVGGPKSKQSATHRPRSVQGGRG